MLLDEQQHHGEERHDGVQEPHRLLEPGLTQLTGAQNLHISLRAMGVERSIENVRNKKGTVILILRF